MLLAPGIEGVPLALVAAAVVGVDLSAGLLLELLEECNPDQMPAIIARLTAGSGKLVPYISRSAPYLPISLRRNTIVVQPAFAQAMLGLATGACAKGSKPP